MPDTSSAQPPPDPNSSDSAALRKLLNYAPVLLGLLADSTLLSLLSLALDIFFCRRSDSSISTPSIAVYQPVQFSHAKHSADVMYHDEVEPYGA